MGQKKFHYVFVALICRPAQGRFPIRVAAGEQFGIAFEQCLNFLQVAFPGSVMNFVAESEPAGSQRQDREGGGAEN
jgi:hypothetical protein